MAQSGHPDRVGECPLSGVQRIWFCFSAFNPVKSGTFCKVSSQPGALGRLWEDAKAAMEKLGCRAAREAHRGPLRYLSQVSIVEPPAQHQHGADAFQKLGPLFWRDISDGSAQTAHRLAGSVLHIARPRIFLTPVLQKRFQPRKQL